MLAIICSSCQQQLAVEEYLAGNKVNCPNCGQLTVVAVAAGATDSEAQRRPPPPTPDLPTITPSQPRVSVSPLAPPSGNADATVGVTPDAGPDGYLTDCLAPPQAADELGRLGKYRILKILGHGGMGVVYQAEDLKLKRTVALKAMLPALAASASSGKRFLREAEAMAAVEHDHIVRIYQIDEERKVPFMAMEFLKGESLHERLKRSEPMQLAELLRIGREIAEGLAAAHTTGLIHRDIKPGNIWLEAPRNRVKILDFGLARAASQEAGLTHQGAIIGTPAYMAPEQGSGGKVDARSDLFSLGVVLYRMGTGEQPFCGTDAVSTLLAVATHEPPPAAERNPHLPQALSDLVMRLLKKDPAQRPASAGEVVRTLQGIEKELAEGKEAPPAHHAKDGIPATPPRAAQSRPGAGVSERAPNHSASGEEPAPEDRSLFGIGLARLVRIPLRRWKLSLVALAVAACAGYLHAKHFSTSMYTFLAKLSHRPPKAQEGIPSPKTLEALMEELKTLKYYKQLNQQLGFGIPAEFFVRMFSIQKGPEDSGQIRVGLTWEDNEEGAKIVNALIAIQRHEVEDARKADLETARKRTIERLKESSEELEKARKAAQAVLIAKKFTGTDPQKRLDDLRRSIADAETDCRKTRLQSRDTDREIERLKAEMAKTEREIDKRKRGGVKEDGVSDPEYVRKVAELNQRLLDLKQTLRQEERELAEAKDQHDTSKPLYEKGLLTTPDWKKRVSRYENARDKVEFSQKRLVLAEEERRQLQPGVAALQTELGQMGIELKRLVKAQLQEKRNVALAEETLARLGEEVRALAAVLPDWERPARQIKLQQKDQERLLDKKARLDDLLAGVDQELVITELATPAGYAITDFKKKMIDGFVVALLLCFGGIVVLESWRTRRAPAG